MNNLNKYTKIALWVIAVIILLGVAGRCDRNEQVVYNMPDDVYRTIKAELGDPSDDRIAEEYLKRVRLSDSVKTGSDEIWRLF